VVRREEGLAGCAERADGAKVELAELVTTVVFLVGRRIGHWRGSAVDGRRAHSHGWCAPVDVGVRGTATRVVCAYGECLVLGVVLRLEVFMECHCASGANHARGDAAGFVAEDEAGDDVEEADDDGEDARGYEEPPEGHG